MYSFQLATGLVVARLKSITSFYEKTIILNYFIGELEFLRNSMSPGSS